MVKYLINSTLTFRVHTVEDAENLQQELKNDGRFDLVAFSYTTKDIKEHKEVVDQYQICKAKIIFQSEKEPDRHIEVSYDEI